MRRPYLGRSSGRDRRFSHKGGYRGCWKLCFQVWVQVPWQGRSYFFHSQVKGMKNYQKEVIRVNGKKRIPDCILKWQLIEVKSAMLC
jgi:hypothetical protein